MFLDLQAVNSNGEERGKVKCYEKKTDNCLKKNSCTLTLSTLKNKENFPFTTYVHLSLSISTINNDQGRDIEKNTMLRRKTHLKRGRERRL